MGKVCQFLFQSHRCYTLFMADQCSPLLNNQGQRNLQNQILENYFPTLGFSQICGESAGSSGSDHVTNHPRFIVPSLNCFRQQTTESQLEYVAPFIALANVVKSCYLETVKLLPHGNLWNPAVTWMFFAEVQTCQLQVENVNRDFKQSHRHIL